MNIGRFFSGIFHGGRRDRPGEASSSQSPSTSSGSAGGVGGTGASDQGAQKEATGTSGRTDQTFTTDVEQRGRIEGQFTADLYHDVLVNAGVNLTKLGTQVEMGAPQVLSSKAVTTADGQIEVEDVVRIELVVTTKRRLATFADVLDNAYVKDGKLVTKIVTEPVQQDGQTVGISTSATQSTSATPTVVPNNVARS